MAAKRKLYEPGANNPFALSRSKLELFLECPRCFYLDRRCGVGRVSGPRFTLNMQVDELLKKEFDVYRSRREPHPLMLANGIDAVPYMHGDLETWRNSFRGIRYLHRESNFEVYGGIDDVWITPAGQLLIVDYKAKGPGKDLANDTTGAAIYKRQAEVYQWLFRKNGFAVSDTAYLLYASCTPDRERFDAHLAFELAIHPCECDSSWIDNELVRAKACLEEPLPSAASENCPWCKYVEAAGR